MMGIIRLRGSIKMRQDKKDTFSMLRLKKKNTLLIMDDNDSRMGMVRKVGDFVAWGELSDEVLGEIKTKFGDKKMINLKPPKGGLKSVKVRAPKGNLGYNGEKINELIKKMM